MAVADQPTKVVGQALKRREDPRLITGKGNFVDDIKLTGMLHAAVLALAVRACQDRLDRRRLPRVSCLASSP